MQTNQLLQPGQYSFRMTAVGGKADIRLRGEVGGIHAANVCQCMRKMGRLALVIISLVTCPKSHSISGPCP